MLGLNLVVEEAFVEALAENHINGESQEAAFKPHLLVAYVCFALAATYICSNCSRAENV